MAKLLFETDSGETHEIKLDTVKTKNLAADDVIIANYEVGDLPEDQKQLAGAELLRLRSLLMEAFPEGSKILVTAMRHGKEDISIKIVKNQKASAAAEKQAKAAEA